VNILTDWPFQSTKETLCGYACFLAEHFKSSGSVRNYLSGIKTWTVLLKFDVEDFYSPTLKMTLSGVGKTKYIYSEDTTTS